MTAAVGTERSEQIAEYAELAKTKREAQKPAQLAPVFGGRGNEGGTRAAARDLGIDRDTVRRAEKIAAIAPEAKAAAECAVVAEIAALEEREMAAVKAWIAGGCEGP